MHDLLTAIVFLEALAKQGKPSGAPAASAEPSPSAAPPGTVPVSPAAPPGTVAPMPPWQGAAAAPVPAALPVFPGPGWVPDVPLSPTIIARAEYWNPQLWNFQTKTIVRPYAQEQFGGRWLTFVAAWHPGKDGPHTYMATECWRLATDQALPEAPPADPVAVPAVPIPVVSPPPGTPLMAPPPVGAEPAPGAWKTSGPFITRYQSALGYLSQTKGKPAWSPKTVDGKYGPNTASAVMAFQRDHALAADGQCGNQTAAALDADLGYGPAPQPAPAPVPIPPAAVPHAAAPPPAQAAAQAPQTPIPASAPAQVAPYPGPGAWQSNAAYIGRYQNALTYLAHMTGNASLDTQGIDGKFGPHTQAAVKAFQVMHGLAQDGEAGAATATALDQAVSQVAHANAAA